MLRSRSERTWASPPEPSAVAEARGFVADGCRGMPAAHVEVARLLASELVTNALLHGSGEVTVVVVREGGDVRVEVHDGSLAMPVLAEGPSRMEGGRGLQLVSKLASTWGVLPHVEGQPGKQVWFALTEVRGIARFLPWITPIAPSP